MGVKCGVIRTSHVTLQFKIIGLPKASKERVEHINPNLCLSYANCLLVNGAVIISPFGDRQAGYRDRDILNSPFQSES